MNPLLASDMPFSITAVERLGWVLVHSLWQFAIVALIAGVAVRALLRRSAEVRYAVLVAAMGGSVAAPAATWMLLPGDAANAMASRGAVPVEENADASNQPVDAPPVGG